MLLYYKYALSKKAFNNPLCNGLDLSRLAKGQWQVEGEIPIQILDF